MRQLLFVHGGDSWKHREECLEMLRTDEIADPFIPVEARRWKYTLAEHLGSEWACALPSFPNKEAALHSEWALWFERHFPFVRDGIVLIGHSLGGNFLAKYLAENNMPVSIAQLHLVAPSWSEGDFVLPDSLANIERQCSQIHLWHSHDDPICPFAAHAEKYAAALPAAHTHYFDDRSHFFGETFPELVEIIKSAA